MDKASDYESGDCRFESCQGQHFFAQKLHLAGNKNAPPDGLQPPTFRLTAERASRLRQGDDSILHLHSIPFRQHFYKVGYCYFFHYHSRFANKKGLVGWGQYPRYFKSYIAW